MNTNMYIEPSKHDLRSECGVQISGIIWVQEFGTIIWVQGFGKMNTNVYIKRSKHDLRSVFGVSGPRLRGPGFKLVVL